MKTPNRQKTTLYTSPRLLKLAGACGQKRGSGVGLDQLLTYLKAHDLPHGPNDEIDLLTVLDSNGPDDALWGLRAVLPEQAAIRDRLARLYACRCAEDVAHLWVAPSGVTWKPQDTIEVARRYANGQATADELAEARRKAWAAVWVAASASAVAASAAAWAVSASALAVSAWAVSASAVAASASAVAVSASAVAASASAREKYTLWFREMFGPDQP